MYGRTLAQLSAEFQLAMRREYYPVSDNYAPLTVVARLVAPQAIKPAALELPDGSQGLAYTSPKSGFATIYETALDDDGSGHALVVSGESSDFASLHEFDSRIDGSRKGFLLFSSKHEERDALVIYDLNEGKIAGRYEFPHIISMLSPTWSPDREAIIFSGLSDAGVSDLYRMRLPGGEVEHLTDDRLPGSRPESEPRRTWPRLRVGPDRGRTRRSGEPVPAQPGDRRDPSAHRAATGWTRRPSGPRTTGSSSPRAGMAF